MSDKQEYYLYKLVPPRPTFFADQTGEEQEIMARHIQYWKGKLDEGTAVAFGPVLEPAGVWGLAVIEVATQAEAEQIRDFDPVVTTGLGTAQIHPTARAVVRARSQG